MKRVLQITIVALMILSLMGCESKEVKNTSDLIKSIGEVSLDSGELIIKAEQAYDALSDEDKGKVKNYDVLVEARKQFDYIYLRHSIVGEWDFYAYLFISDEPFNRYIFNEDGTGSGWSWVSVSTMDFTWDLDENMKILHIHGPEELNLTIDQSRDYIMLKTGYDSFYLVQNEKWMQTRAECIVTISVNKDNFHSYFGNRELVYDYPDGGAYYWYPSLIRKDGLIHCGGGPIFYWWDETIDDALSWTGGEIKYYFIKEEFVNKVSVENHYRKIYTDDYVIEMDLGQSQSKYDNMFYEAVGKLDY